MLLRGLGQINSFMPGGFAEVSSYFHYICIVYDMYHSNLLYCDSKKQARFYIVDKCACNASLICSFSLLCTMKYVMVKSHNKNHML